MKVKLLLSFIVAPLFLISGNTMSRNSDMDEDISISLNPKSIVLGPSITLADVSTINIVNLADKKSMGNIEIGSAPPPGESSEIMLSYIKRKLKKAGFQKYLTLISGPKTIRVITAHKEIDRVFHRKKLVFSHDEQSLGALLNKNPIAIL